MADDEIDDLLRRLRMFFANRGARQQTQDLASEVVTRVLAAQAAGTVIDSLTAYALGTAKLVWFEHLRARQAAPDGLDLDPAAPEAVAPDDPEAARCLRRCLLHLPPESRRLFMTYVAGPGKNKDRRAGLAAGLGINTNALQQRISALRATLRRCLTACTALTSQHGADGGLR